MDKARSKVNGRDSARTCPVSHGAMSGKRQTKKAVGLAERQNLKRELFIVQFWKMQSRLYLVIS